MSLEPWYSIEVAAELIPCSRSTLEHILSKYPDEFDSPRYHIAHNVKGNPSLRILTEAECLTVRGMIIKTGNYQGKGGHRHDVMRQDRFGIFLGVSVIG